MQYSPSYCYLCSIFSVILIFWVLPLPQLPPVMNMESRLLIYQYQIIFFIILVDELILMHISLPLVPFILFYYFAPLVSSCLPQLLVQLLHPMNVVEMLVFMDSSYNSISFSLILSNSFSLQQLSLTRKLQLSLFTYWYYILSFTF